MVIELIGIAISLTVLAGNCLLAWSRWVKWETRARIAECDLVEARKTIAYWRNEFTKAKGVLHGLQRDIEEWEGIDAPDQN